MLSVRVWTGFVWIGTETVADSSIKGGELLTS